MRCTKFGPNNSGSRNVSLQALNTAELASIQQYTPRDTDFFCVESPQVPPVSARYEIGI
jgi:hypothetical protein